MIRRFAAVACAVGMVLAGVTACGSSGSGGGSGSSGGGSGAGTVRLGLVQAKDFTVQSFYTAQQKGYFKDNGVTVKVTSFSAGADAVKALAAGQIDVIVGTGFDSSAAVSKGVPLQVFASVAQKSSFLLIAGKKSGITSMTDVKGKKIAMTAFGSLTDYAVRYEAQHAGLDPKTGVKEVPLGALPAQAAALAAGSVDAFNTPPSFAYTLADKGTAKIVGKFNDINPNTQFTVLEASPKFLESHKALVKNFLAAYYKGVNLFKSDKKWGLQATEDALKLPPDIAKRVYDELAPHLTSDGTVNTKALEAYAKANKELGITTSVPKLDEYYTGEFLPVKTS
jgi:NitT/TauT family transport system substrate-binding protein